MKKNAARVYLYFAGRLHKNECNTNEGDEFLFSPFCGVLLKPDGMTINQSRRQDHARTYQKANQPHSVLPGSQSRCRGEEMQQGDKRRFHLRTHNLARIVHTDEAFSTEPDPRGRAGCARRAGQR